MALPRLITSYSVSQQSYQTELLLQRNVLEQIIASLPCSYLGLAASVVYIIWFVSFFPSDYDSWWARHLSSFENCKFVWICRAGIQNFIKRKFTKRYWNFVHFVILVRFFFEFNSCICGLTLYRSNNSKLEFNRPIDTKERVLKKTHTFYCSVVKAVGVRSWNHLAWLLPWREVDIQLQCACCHWQPNQLVTLKKSGVSLQVLTTSTPAKNKYDKVKLYYILDTKLRTETLASSNCCRNSGTRKFALTRISKNFCLSISLPKANLTKPIKLLNPELSNET